MNTLLKCNKRHVEQFLINTFCGLLGIQQPAALTSYEHLGVRVCSEFNQGLICLYPGNHLHLYTVIRYSVATVTYPQTARAP